MGTPDSGLHGEALPERGYTLQAEGTLYKRVGISRERGGIIQVF